MKNKLIREYLDEDDDEKEYNLEHNGARALKEFFIDPEGTIHQYEGDLSGDIISMHSRIAEQLFPDSIDPETDMMNDGWILVGSSVYNCPIIHKKPTKAQLKTLNDLGLYKRLCGLYKNTYPNYDRYQGLWE